MTKYSSNITKYLSNIIKYLYLFFLRVVLGWSVSSDSSAPKPLFLQAFWYWKWNDQWWHQTFFQTGNSYAASLRWWKWFRKNSQSITVTLTVRAVKHPAVYTTTLLPSRSRMHTHTYTHTLCPSVLHLFRIIYFWKIEPNKITADTPDQVPVLFLVFI